MSISQIVSSQLNSEQAIYADYIANKGRRIIGAHDKRLLVGDQSVPTLNSSSSVDHWFTLQRFGNKMYRSLKLYFSTSALTSAGSPTYLRLVDGYGIFAFERIQVHYGGKMVSEVFADSIYSRYLQDNADAEYDSLANAVGLGLSTGARNTAAAGVQYFVLDLDESFDWLNQPYERHLLSSDDFKIMFRIRAISDVVELDTSAPSFSFTNFKLGYDLVDSNPLIDQFLVQQMTTGYGKQLHQITPIYITKALSSVTTTEVDLSILQGKDVVSVDFFVRTAASATDKKFNTLDTSISSWNMQAGNKYVSGAEFDITKEIFRKWFLYTYDIVGQEQLMSAKDLFVISFSDSLKSQFGEHNQVYSGSKRFETNDVKMTVNFSSSFTGTLTIIVNRIQPTFIRNGEFLSGY